MSQSALFTPREARPEAARPRIVRSSPSPRARRPVLAVACMVVVLGAAAVVTSAFSHASGHALVLIARHAIPVGAVIEASDITTSKITGTGSISAISASHESQILGRTTSVALSAGEVIPRGVIGTAASVPTGQAVVGMSLTVDQLPAGGVVPGQSVEVVVVSPPGSPASGAPGSTATQTPANPFATASAPGALPGPGSVIVAQALVVKATPPPANSAASFAQDVSLEVPSALSSQIVTLAAAKQIGLALVASTSGASS